MAVKERGEIPFGEAGPGVVLRFTNYDLKAIAQESPDGKAWFMRMMDTFMVGFVDIDTIELLMVRGAKKENSGEAIDPEIVKAAMEKLPIHQMGEKVMDAACMAMGGLETMEFIADRHERSMKAMEAEAAGKPLPPSEPGTIT